MQEKLVYWKPNVSFEEKPKKTIACLLKMAKDTKHLSHWKVIVP
jgi:hypothetical protein